LNNPCLHRAGLEFDLGWAHAQAADRIPPLEPHMVQSGQMLSEGLLSDCHADKRRATRTQQAICLCCGDPVQYTFMPKVEMEEFARLNLAGGFETQIEMMHSTSIPRMGHINVTGLASVR